MFSRSSLEEKPTFGLLLGLAEEVAHAGGSHADEHLHEVGAADGEEGHVGLAGDGLGQQGLTRARRAYQQSSFGYLSAQGGVFLGILQEVHLGLLQTGHVLEGHFHIVLLLIELGLGLADVEDAASRASAHVLLHRTEHDEPQQSE